MEIPITNTQLANLVSDVLKSGKVGNIVLTPLEFEQIAFEVADALSFILGGKVGKEPHLKGDPIPACSCTVLVNLETYKRDFGNAIWQSYANVPAVQIKIASPSAEKHPELTEARLRLERKRGRNLCLADPTHSFKLN